MNVLQAVKEVKDFDYLRECLGIFKDPKQFLSEAQQRKEYIKFFIEHDPEASWRSVICILDGMAQEDALKAADNIRHLAERIPGIRHLPSSEVASVCRIISHSYPL